jgi:MFS family permease
MVKSTITKDIQYYKFGLYGFFKNLRFFESFLILFFLSKDLSYVEIGFLYSIRELTIFVTEIPSGAIADSLGRRKIMIMAFAIYILSFLIFYLGNSFFIFSAAMLLFAFADAFRTGVHKAMIFNYLQRYGWEELKADYYGHTRAWSQAGSAFSALAAAGIVFYSGNYNVIFLASIIPYLLDMTLIISYPKWLDGELKNFDTIGIKEKFKQVESAFVLTLKKFVFLKTLINLTLYTGYYKSVKDYIQPLIKSYALSVPALAYLNNDKKIALFIGIFYFVVYFMTSFTSKNSGKFLNLFRNYEKPMNLTIIIGLTAGILSGGIYLTGFYFISIAGFIFILIIENLRKPIGVAVIADITHDNAMATILSVTSQVQSIFAAVISPLIGWIADKYGPGLGIAIISISLLLLFPFYKLKTKVVY